MLLTKSTARVIPLSGQDRLSLRKQMAFISEFRRVRPTMPLQHAYAFMLVAMNEGKSVAEYAQLAAMSQSVMTRNLLDLGVRNRKKEPGYGLVEQRMDPMDMRRHFTYLTHEGRALIKRLVATWE